MCCSPPASSWGCSCDTYNRFVQEENMPGSRIVLYFFIAAAVSLIAYYNLANEPHPDWPINLVHLLARH